MVRDLTHVLNRADMGGTAPSTASEPGGLHCGGRMLGYAMPQPNKGDSGLEGDMQGCGMLAEWRDGRLLVARH